MILTMRANVWTLVDKGSGQMAQIPDAAVGTVIAALIAGIVSLLGLTISKEQKTSEFRQAWIDSLRSDLTAFLTHINAIHDAIQVKYTDHAKKVETLRPLYVALNTSTFNILLRVNPIEAKSKRLLNAMEAFNSLTADEAKLTTENIRGVEAEFLAASQALLKSEWRRVKSGEWTFKVAKLLALSLVLSTLVAGSFMAVRAWWAEVDSARFATAQSIASPSSTPSSGRKTSVRLQPQQ